MMICAYIYFCSWYMLTLSIYIYMFFLPVAKCDDLPPKSK